MHFPSCPMRGCPSRPRHGKSWRIRLELASTSDVLVAQAAQRRLVELAS